MKDKTSHGSAVQLVKCAILKVTASDNVTQAGRLSRRDAISRSTPRLHRFPTLDDSHQHENNGNDEQDVNEATHGVGTDISQQPQDEQYYGNGL